MKSDKENKPSIDDGGTAFPMVIPEDYTTFEYGMTLRDYFATHAMQAVIAHTELVEDGVFLVGPAPGTSAIDNFACFAYVVADAMIMARKAVRS